MVKFAPRALQIRCAEGGHCRLLVETFQNKQGLIAFPLLANVSCPETPRNARASVSRGETAGVGAFNASIARPTWRMASVMGSTVGASLWVHALLKAAERPARPKPKACQHSNVSACPFAAADERLSTESTAQSLQVQGRVPLLWFAQ